VPLRDYLRFLTQPLARDCDINSPSTTQLRRRILLENPFLRRIYEEWYGAILETLPAGPGRILEIGTGAGFLSQRLPGLITSEIFQIPGLDLVLDSCRLPFAAQSLRAIVMTDVLHHIPDVRQFLNQASACVKPGGAIVMIEPWDSAWSRWIFTHLHHEPYQPDAERWEFPSTGPLSGANGALPWIVFERDKARFAAEHPQWQVVSILPMMPFRYLLSGGVTYRSLVPGWTFPLWRAIDRTVQRFGMAMFARIVVRRCEDPDRPRFTNPSLPR